MTTVDVRSQLTYRLQGSTSFLFQVAAATTPHQTVERERFILTPELSPEACQVGPLGNRVHRLTAEAGLLTLTYEARVALRPFKQDITQLPEVAHAQLPADVLPYLNPSRYCASDRLTRLAFDTFGDVTPGHARVAHIVDWVHHQLSYVPGSTGPGTDACDVLLQREGVCRDYAHVGIALCRAMGIPARYVAGYAVDLQPPDFHGFFEAYLGNAWYLFDATRLAPVSGFVRIGAGRDAADVSFATLIGPAQNASVTVSALVADASGLDAAGAGEAVSTS